MINNSESVKIGLTQIQSEPVFHCYEHIVKKTRDADVVIPTHIEFDRLDLLPLNYTFEIYIANEIITSVSNELINDNDIAITQECSILKYKIKLPLEGLFPLQNGALANSNISGIINVALQFHEVKYSFKTTNNITNVNVYQQQISLDQEIRRTVLSRILEEKAVRLHYEYAYCNRKNMIRHHGITKGYYIHCDKPIFNIKIQRSRDDIIIMDKKYIETECKQINSNTLYVPLQSGHIPGGYICMTINETENFCKCMNSVQVCIISEHIVDIVYHAGMFTVTTICSVEGLHKYNSVLCSS